jgi:hypothetical protein
MFAPRLRIDADWLSINKCGNVAMFSMGVAIGLATLL